MRKLSKICIIDDDSIFTYSLQKLITTHQFADEVVTFIDAEEAIIFIEENMETPENLPDLIFLDITMPMMSGWEFLKDFDNLTEQIQKKMELMVVSSSLSQNDINKAKSHKSVSGCINKPITLPVFQDILNQISVE